MVIGKGCAVHRAGSFLVVDEVTFYGVRALMGHKLFGSFDRSNCSLSREDDSREWF